MARGEDERHNPNRRPERPIINFLDPKYGSSDGLGKSLSDFLKQQVYDAEFNDIVGLPNDIVAEPDEDKNNG